MNKQTLIASAKLGAALGAALVAAVLLVHLFGAPPLPASPPTPSTTEWPQWGGASGKPYWVYRSGAQVWGSTLVADGKVFLPTHRGLVVLAEGKKMKLLGKSSVGSELDGSPVAVKDTLYVTSRHDLWAVRR